MSGRRFNPTGDKIRLRERGWAYDKKRRAWWKEVAGVRVYALTAETALNVTVVKVQTTPEEVNEQ